jgi:hypothetical protein
VPGTKRGTTAKKDAAESGATLGFETKLWLAADELRNNMDAAEYKHVVLALIFLKYIASRATYSPQFRSPCRRSSVVPSRKHSIA